MSLVQNAKKAKKKYFPWVQSQPKLHKFWEKRCASLLHFFFKVKAFIMAQGGDEAASKSDVTSLDTKQDLDFDNDTLKGK